MKKKDPPGRSGPPPAKKAGAGASTYPPWPAELSDLTADLFNCWLAAADRMALWTTFVYFIGSLVAAFIVSALGRFYELGWWVYTLKANFYVVCSLGLVAVGVRVLFLRRRFKPGSAAGLGRTLPEELWVLAYVEDRIIEARAKAHTDAAPLEYLANAFEREFGYWNERLKNVSTIIIAVGGLIGLATNELLLTTTAVVSSWTLLINLHTTKVAQRGSRYLKHLISRAGKG